jgi:hypothetical protein
MKEEPPNNNAREDAREEEPPNLPQSGRVRMDTYAREDARGADRGDGRRRALEKRCGTRTRAGETS